MLYKKTFKSGYNYSTTNSTTLILHKCPISIFMTIFSHSIFYFLNTSKSKKPSQSREGYMEKIGKND